MKFTTLSSALLSASLASAATLSQSTFSWPTDASSVLSLVYLTPPAITGAPLTSFASELVSIETAWENSPGYTAAEEAVLSALPQSLLSSFASAASTENYQQLTAEPWYTNVAASARSALSSQQAQLDSAYNKYIVSSTTSHAGTEARATAVWGAAAVGAVGAMLAL